MIFPATGIFAVLFTILSIIQNKKFSNLLAIWVFFIPFTATAWINFQYSGDYKSISIAHFISLIIILLHFIKFKKIQTINLKYFFILSTLNAFIVLSLFVNILWPTEIHIYSAVYFMKDELLDIHITARNFFNFIYFIMGSTMFLILIERVQSKDFFLKLLRIYIISTGFMSLWGIMQWILFYLNLEYPSYIFNTSLNVNALGYTGTFEDIKRISSFATEPSIMAQTIIVGLSLLLFTTQNKILLFNTPMYYFLVISMIIALLLSTSFLAYLSLLVLYFIYIARHKYLMILSFVFGLLLLYLFMPLIELKLVSYSILERTNSVIQAFTYWLDALVFGFGFSSITSHDLVINLLVNIGLIGFIPFIILLIFVFQENRNQYSKPMTETLFVFLTTQFLTGFAYTYFIFWFVLSLVVMSTRVESSYTGEYR